MKRWMGSKRLNKWKNINDFISENQRKLVFLHTIAIGQRVKVPVDVHVWHLLACEIVHWRKLQEH